MDFVAMVQDQALGPRLLARLSIPVRWVLPPTDRAPCVESTSPPTVATVGKGRAGERTWKPAYLVVIFRGNLTAWLARATTPDS